MEPFEYAECDVTRLTPEEMLAGYRHGVFLMAESKDEPDLMWISPLERGILPIHAPYFNKRFMRWLRGTSYRLRINHAFDQLLHYCTIRPQEQEADSWINPTLTTHYRNLHLQGKAHSFECWDGTKLVGGLFGIALNGAFFGESMVSLTNNASKFALIHLLSRLWTQGFILLDTQFLTSHLQSLGAINLSRPDYLKILDNAMATHVELDIKDDAKTNQTYLSAYLAHLL